MNPEIAEVLAGTRRWTVLCADNAEVLPTLPDKSVAHFVTDPPYSEHVHNIGQIHKGKGETFGFAAVTDELIVRISTQAARVSTRWTLLFCDAESVHAWRVGLIAADLPPLRVGAWIKPDAMPQLTGDRPAAGFESVVIAHPKGRKKWNGGGLPAVWTHCIERKDRIHPTQKPLPLMLELVAQFTDPGDVILDPFCGSGATGVAAVRLGRRFIGLDLDPTHARAAADRMAAEVDGLSLTASRAGQLPMFGGQS